MKSSKFCNELHSSSNEMQNLDFPIMARETEIYLEKRILRSNT